MRMYDLITKKKHGEELTKEEINFIVQGFTNDTIPDYQMSALMMAIYFKGMNTRETVDLTQAMIDSGDRLDLSRINGKKADKHSTGGVGDKTSLIVGPMVACCGVPVAKMSGRGLGHTGGTIDKLESFPGFSIALTDEQFIENVNKIGLAIIGQTADLCPADKKMYALRDVTATVDNISLIASSIMSKKLAAGTDAIVLDVKVGSGAFMKTIEDAKALAELMVKIGNMCGKKTYAVLSDMSQPLGYCVGNSLEAYEAIEALKGNGREDLMEACYTLGSYMLVGTDNAPDATTAKAMLEDTIKSGKAFEKFKQFIAAQGGDTTVVDNPELFKRTEYKEDIISMEEGYVSEILTDEIGMTSLILGGGRETKTSEIDLSVGLKIRKKIGDYVKKGEALVTLYANDVDKLKNASERVYKAYTISKDKVIAPKHVLGIVTAEGTTIY